jgi:uncharacterized membrane protein YkvA (DUF1232 family)
MKVTFELSKKDLGYFRTRLKSIRASRSEDDEETILQGAEQLLVEAHEAEPPEFVVIRLATLRQLIDLLQDQEWRLEGRDRVRILDALAYFVDPDDMIPDRLPGIGYLDDAIMVELIAQELKHEIKAYEDFCEFRRTRPESKDVEKLERRRKALQARMRRRARRDLDDMRSRRRTNRDSFRLSGRGAPRGRCPRRKPAQKSPSGRS